MTVPGGAGMTAPAADRTGTGATGTGASSDAPQRAGRVDLLLARLPLLGRLVLLADLPRQRGPEADRDDGVEGRGGLPPALVRAGLVGSVLTAVGGVGAGALPRPAPGAWFGVELLASNTVLWVVSYLLVVLGVGLLVTAWWRSQRVLDGVSSRAMARATALWSLPLMVGPPMFSRDIYAYGAQGVVVARGFNPYRLGPIEGGGAFSAHVDTIWRDTPSPYGPAYLGPASWVVRLTGSSVVPTVLLLRLLAVAGVVLAGWALVRLARSSGVAPQRALWLGVANPLVLLHGVAGAHNDVLMVGFMLAGLVVALRPSPGHWRLVAAGALITLGILVKAPAAAALPALVLAAPRGRPRLRAAALLAAGGAATGLVVQLATGVGTGWIGTLGTGRKVLSVFSPTTGIGTVLGSAARLLHLVDSTGAVRTPVLLLGTAVGGLAALLFLLLTPRLGALRAIGLAMLAVVVFSPTVLPWYPLWGVLPLAACVRRRTASALGAVCLVLSLATQPNGSSTAGSPFYGLPAVLAVAAAAAVTWPQSVRWLRRASRPASP